RTLFHQSSWLDFIAATRADLAVEYFRIESEGAVVGYFCTFRKTKFNMSIWGFPFAGAGMYLDPLLKPGSDESAFWYALFRFCADNQVAHVEIIRRHSNVALMKSIGFHVRQRGWNSVCRLDRGEDAAWERMRGTCRTRIRKAERSNLRAEITSN